MMKFFSTACLVFFSFKNFAGPVKPQLERFKAGSIRVGGEILQRMELTADKILRHMDLEEIFLSHYKNRSDEPTVHGGFTGFGMFLDAVVKGAAHGIRGREMVQCKEKLVQEILSTQSSDGNISIYKSAPGFWDNHDQAYLIQALTLDHRYFGNKKSLEGAVKLGDFLIKRESSTTLGLESAFLMLYEETKEERFLEYGKKAFALGGSFKEYDSINTVNSTSHVYTAIARALANLQFHTLQKGAHTGELPEDCQEILRRIFQEGYCSASGTCSGGISTGEAWDNSQSGRGKWGETCASAYLMRFLAHCMTFRADSRYGDLYERILYNAFFAAQSADGLRQRYFNPFNEAYQWYEHETYCCPNNLRRMMFEIPESIYFKTSDNGVCINLYAESTLQTDEVVITQETNYPKSGLVRIKVSSKKALDLYLRIPSWCSKGTLAVDQKAPAQVKSGSFHCVKLSAGEHALTLDLPMEIRLIRGSMCQAKSCAVLRGSLLYALEGTLHTNNFRGQNLDALCIDTEIKPEWDAQKDLIKVTCQGIRNRRVTAFFSRFIHEERTRTYFPFLKEKNLCKDSLFTEK